MEKNNIENTITNESKYYLKYIIYSNWFNNIINFNNK